jgi:hypothetical protein
MAAMASVTKQREKFAQEAREKRKEQGIETTEDIIYDIKRLQQQISDRPTTMREGLLQYRNELQTIIETEKAVEKLKSVGQTP